MQLSKYRLSFFSISGLVIIIGFIFIILGGLNPGIDFTGGSTLTLKIPNVDSSSEVRNSLSNTQYDNSIIQNFGNNTFFIRTVMIDDDQKKNILQNLDTITPDKDVEVLSFDLISPLIANETVVNAIWAVLAATIGIFVYIWWAFRNVPNPLRYSVVAIIALLHDTLIVVGIFALLGFFLDYEINTMFIIAFLTVLGYSVNDSIVVLDRLRSNTIDFGGMRLSQMVDLSISQTFGRSLNTSITLLVTLLAMYIFGGDTLKPFILVLMVGVISGTYSSIAIATQILVIWDERN
ncbi:MAG TPA: protein translocase subunit SecF [Nitrososphaerales archaeon]|nr:protein translocase subunit SecF [Nitrososphaerales archaeon]